jgi:hypothetical protein
MCAMIAPHRIKTVQKVYWGEIGRAKKKPRALVTGGAGF